MTNPSSLAARCILQVFCTTVARYVEQQARFLPPRLEQTHGLLLSWQHPLTLFCARYLLLWTEASMSQRELSCISNETYAIGPVCHQSTFHLRPCLRLSHYVRERADIPPVAA